MTLRVLFLVNSLCVGGAEKHVVSLLNGLDGRRHRLGLTALKRNDALLPQIDRQQVCDGITCLEVDRGLDWGAAKRLSRQMDEQGTDILVCTNMYALLYGWLARRLSRRAAQVRLQRAQQSRCRGRQPFELRDDKGYGAPLAFAQICDQRRDFGRR